MPAETPTRRALLIGIGQYLHPRMTPLRGSLNDVEAMSTVLRERFGFPPENITILRNEQATRDGILAALAALVTSTQTDDIVVISYHGHGSQMTARASDEPDALDETLVPYDSGRGSEENRDITDDELHSFLLQLRQITAHLTLIFDSCHSGSITRDSFGVAARVVESDRRPPAALPPLSSAALAGRAAREMGKSLGAGYVCLSSCADDEIAFEHRSQGLHHGALTYFLTRALAAGQPGTTWRDIFEQVSIQVTAHKWRQHPQLEGERDRELFGAIEQIPFSYFPIVSRAGHALELAAGAVHDLAVGSELLVYPPGTKAADATSLGRVRVTEVRSASSRAEIISEGTPSTILPACRAVEEIRAYPEAQLRVEVVAPDDPDSARLASALCEKLSGSQLLKTQDVAAGESDVRVSLIADRGAAVWAITGQDGSLLAPTCPTSTAAMFGSVRRSLERLAKYRQALTLTNPDPRSRLRGKVELVLLRRNGEGAFVPAAPEGLAPPVFTAGDSIAGEIRNLSDHPLFVCVLDFEQDLSITQIYPPPGVAPVLPAGARVRFGTDEDDRGFAVSLSSPSGDTQEPPHATEVWKLFATTQAVDLRTLEQEPLRRGSGPEAAPLLGPLGRLLAGGEPIRGYTFASYGDEDGKDWTTLEQRFVIRRGEQR